MHLDQFQLKFAVWAPGVSRVRIACGSRRRGWFCAAKRSSVAFVFILFFVSETTGKQTNSASSTVRGTVFFLDPARRKLPVPGARIVLTGETTLPAETDENGDFVLRAVPYGTYNVEATSAGLKAV